MVRLDRTANGLQRIPMGFPADSEYFRRIPMVFRHIPMIFRRYIEVEIFARLRRGIVYDVTYSALRRDVGD